MISPKWASTKTERATYSSWCTNLRWWCQANSSRDDRVAIYEINWYLWILKFVIGKAYFLRLDGVGVVGSPNSNLNIEYLKYKWAILTKSSIPTKKSSTITSIAVSTTRWGKSLKNIQSSSTSPSPKIPSIQFWWEQHSMLDCKQFNMFWARIQM